MLVEGSDLLLSSMHFGVLESEASTSFRPRPGSLDSEVSEDPGGSSASPGSWAPTGWGWGAGLFSSSASSLLRKPEEGSTFSLFTEAGAGGRPAGTSPNHCRARRARATSRPCRSPVRPPSPPAGESRQAGCEERVASAGPAGSCTLESPLLKVPFSQSHRPGSQSQG